MNSTSAGPSSKPTSTTSALRWLGDLDHPMFQDERQRCVLYEAAAIGFQALFLGAYVVAGASLWIAGANALPYALAFFVPVLLGVQAVQSFTKAQGIEYWPTKTDFTRPRGRVNVAVLAFVLAGGVRAILDKANDEGSFFEGLGLTMSFGVVCGVAAVVLMNIRQGRRARAREEAAALVEM